MLSKIKPLEWYKMNGGLVLPYVSFYENRHKGNASLLALILVGDEKEKNSEEKCFFLLFF